MFKRLTKFTLLAYILATAGSIYLGAACWVPIQGTTCMTDGTQIDTAFVESWIVCEIPDYWTHVYAVGNWTWDDRDFFFDNGTMSGSANIFAGSFQDCCGDAKYWDQCSNDWVVFDYGCLSDVAGFRGEGSCP